MGAKADDCPLLEPANRSQLRAWLEANHATSRGIRLAIGKVGNSVTQLTYEDAIEEALAFGWIDSKSGRLDADRYTVMFTPRKPGGTWARSNKERVARLAAEGRMAPAGLAAIESAKADGSWTSLDDVEDVVIPDDLAAALAADPLGERRFEALSVSARKMALHWISSARRPETRAKRVAETLRGAVPGTGGGV